MQDDDSLLLRNNQTFCREDFFPTEQMLSEQLNTGAQEPRVLNIYQNYLFTTQENQLVAFDSFKSLHRLKNFQTLDVGGGIFTALSLEIQFKHTFNSSIL
jgi:hypothetical protein